VSLRVRIEIAPGPYHVGEGIELAAGVPARDQRPALELPRLRQADLWTTGTSFKPLSASGIGPVQAGENVFVTQLRIVPRRAGPLEIPPIIARLGGQSGRSHARRIEVEPVPLEGRPAEFLGGVGDFSVHAAAEPASVRVGQVLTYRIELKGPAAWGSVAPPDLARLRQLALAPRVDARPDELINEPPSRTFIYQIRLTRPGTAVLPPVAIAAFDPRLERFITRVTRGVPITAVAVSSFDAGSLNYSAPEPGRTARAVRAWLPWAAGLVVLLSGAALAVAIHRRYTAARQLGPIGAQRFARKVALLFRHMPRFVRDPQEFVARKSIQGLITYARIGAGRPPGALTPSEARSVVAKLTGSAELADRAAALVERCDRILFSNRPDADMPDPALRGHARDLFEDLGRAPAAVRETVSEPPSPETG
jgi:hypothetical protein